MLLAGGPGGPGVGEGPALHPCMVPAERRCFLPAGRSARAGAEIAVDGGGAVLPMLAAQDPAAYAPSTK